jgi:hypothetical protein
MNMVRWIPFFVVAIGLTAPSWAIAQDANPAGGQVANACTGMGLNPSEAPYAFCAMSLQDVAASAADARRISMERRECARHGYRIGTASFANCVLDREETVSTVGPPPAPVPVAAEDPFRSYQRGDQRTSVRRACARMGLAPGSSEYATCVGNLNMTIDDSNMVGSD